MAPAHTEAIRHVVPRLTPSAPTCQPTRTQGWLLSHDDWPGLPRRRRELQGNPPPLPVHVYKLFFLCRRTGPVQPPQALETLDVGWFGLDGLPPLSLGRVNHRQLQRALAHHRDPSLATEFD